MRIGKKRFLCVPSAPKSFLLQWQQRTYSPAVNVEEIESVVSNLPAEDLARFSKWFEEFVADAWDRQIEEDARAGRFGTAMKRADEHYEAGRCTPEDDQWRVISKSGLARAYSDDEPDYPARLVRKRAALGSREEI